MTQFNFSADNSLAQTVPAPTSSNTQNKSQQSTEAILKAATHFMLMAAHNKAHAELYEECMRSKYQLEVQLKLVSELKEELKEIHCHGLSRLGDSSGSRHGQDSTENGNPKAQNPSITIPYSPPMDKQDDYPHVRFWDKEEWIDYKTRAANRNQSVDKLYFLCNEDGEMVSQARREEMTETAKVAFNELYYWRLDPHTWGKGNQQARDYFSAIMRGKFPEFRWCSNDWKIREFATIRYPDWASHIRKTGDLLRARPSIGKRGTDYNNLTASKPKKRRPNTSLHSHAGEQHIIDVDAVPLPKEVPVPGPSTLPNPEFASDLPHRQESPTVEEILSATAASISTRTSVELVTTLTSNSTNLRTLEDSEVPIVNAEKHTDGLASGTTSNLSGTSEPPAFQRVEDVELTVPNGVQQNAISTRRTRLNPLAGLTIPNPAFEVPGQSALENTSNSESSMVPAQKGKKAKPMVVSKALTARNLFALDYQKTHPNVTAAEFKKVYENLDRDIIKKYEILSKERKAASKAPAAITTSAA
ncbi:hypothetical protein JR316_0005528 [Psilocybe cubensis]|uniref:Uncharacterized protein n=2 Tax=Psilocybe cubensis TaxID=181762 RepID=A0ACB8H1D5_PSICU|nr:hypothetical protein JR316_0005528 [Psilocybe cubensis]KAH9481010.1 hypothetical protein JR316_0005528 [Psilocybe cubensis]